MNHLPYARCKMRIILIAAKCNTGHDPQHPSEPLESDRRSLQWLLLSSKDLNPKPPSQASDESLSLRFVHVSLIRQGYGSWPIFLVRGVYWLTSNRYPNRLRPKAEEKTLAHSMSVQAASSSHKLGSTAEQWSIGFRPQ